MGLAHTSEHCENKRECLLSGASQRVKVSRSNQRVHIIRANKALVCIFKSNKNNCILWESLSFPSIFHFIHLSFHLCCRTSLQSYCFLIISVVIFPQALLVCPCRFSKPSETSIRELRASELWFVSRFPLGTTTAKTAATPNTPPLHP